MNKDDLEDVSFTFPMFRRKIEAIDPEFDEIETVIGAGYRWRSS